MTLSIALIISGFVLLIAGASWLVDGASALAKKNNISELTIGLTIVAFGTSAPELVVNSIASIKNHSDIVMGNVIGSNNFNLFVILGIAGLILPITVQSSTVWKEIPISFIAVLLLFGMSNDFFIKESKTISRIDGVVLFIMFCLFLFYVYHQLKTETLRKESSIQSLSNLKIGGFIIIGLAGLILGGKLVVDNAIKVATNSGVSEKIIGLTIVAAGTSLPELVTSVVAAVKKNSDIAIGNIIGSNVFNIFLIISVSSIIHPIQYNSDFNSDIYFLMAGTAFLFIAMFTGRRKKLDRWEAGLLLAAFILFTILQVGKEI